MTKPKGVVLILSAPNGYVVSANDFEKGGAGGFRPEQNQERRARDKLLRALMKDMCSPLILPALDTMYGTSDLIWRLERDHGWKLHKEYIGYDEGEE